MGVVMDFLYRAKEQSLILIIFRIHQLGRRAWVPYTVRFLIEGILYIEG